MSSRSSEHGLARLRVLADAEMGRAPCRHRDRVQLAQRRIVALALSSSFTSCREPARASRWRSSTLASAMLRS